MSLTFAVITEHVYSGMLYSLSFNDKTEKETNINIDKRVVILFKDEMAYSMVNFNKIKEEHFVRKDTVHVKDGKGRCHEAQVVFIGEFLIRYKSIPTVFMRVRTDPYDV